MNINKAGRQEKAYWRGEQRQTDRWEKELANAAAMDSITPYGIIQERLMGYATGWIDGVNWLKRQQKKGGR